MPRDSLVPLMSGKQNLSAALFLSCLVLSSARSGFWRKTQFNMSLFNLQGPPPVMQRVPPDVTVEHCDHYQECE
jgi:hypothetical protein